jgi:hypothetical protein
MNLIWSGHVADGKLNIRDKPLFLQYLHTLEGKAVQITVGKEVRKRTNPQNSYYWLILTLIGKDLGYSANDVHELMKTTFLKRPLWVRGKFIPTTRSSTSLDTADFTTYIEEIRQWAAEELGMVIPDPEQVAL